MIEIYENGIHLVFSVASDNTVNILHCSVSPFLRVEDHPAYHLVELQVTGENPDGHHATKHDATNPGSRLKYVKHKDYRNEWGRR